MLLEKTLKTKNLFSDFKKSPLKGLSKEDQLRFKTFAKGEPRQSPYTCIHHAFEDYARTQPHAIAIEHEGQSISYGELNDRANALAQYLIQIGVQQGDNVGLFLNRSIELVVGILGVLRTGAAYVPQDVRIVPDVQLQFIAKKANIKIILSKKEFADKLSFHTKTKYLDELDYTNNKEHVFILQGKQTNCFILFTSGTTGMPNGVRITHGNVCNILLSAPGNLGMRPGLKVAQILNISFDMSAWEILGALSNGASLIIRGNSIQETVEKADIVIATPSILASLDSKTCRQVKTVAVAGEPCPKQLADEWSTFSQFYNCCGPTETTIVNTMHNYKGSKQPISIGRPTPNNTVYILDKNLKPLPIGEIGEMWAGGDCVSAGYIGNNRLNFERYKPDPFLGNGRKMFRTRDFGRWNKNGELEHFGRTDDQVKIRGFRIELDSVSTALESIKSCHQAVTLKLDDRKLVAFIRPSTVNIEEAKIAVETKLSYYCLPSLIIPMDAFPKTDRGKINKRELTVLAAQKQEEAKNA